MVRFETSAWTRTGFNLWSKLVRTSLHADLTTTRPNRTAAAGVYHLLLSPLRMFNQKALQSDTEKFAQEPINPVNLGLLESRLARKLGKGQCKIIPPRNQNAVQKI